MTPSEHNALESFKASLGAIAEQTRVCASLYHVHGDMTDTELHAAYMATEYAQTHPVPHRNAATIRRRACQPHYFDRGKQCTIRARRHLCQMQPPIVGDTGKKVMDPISKRMVEKWGLIANGAHPVGLSKTERRDEVLKIAGAVARGEVSIILLRDAIEVYGEGLECSKC